MYDFDSVWATHEFVITRLTENETKYNNLLRYMPTYVEMYEAGSLKKEELIEFIEETERVCLALDGLYRKHLLTIKEIELYIEDNQVPVDKYVIIESLPDLKSTTNDLMKTIKDSKNLINFIKEEKLDGI